MSGFYDTLSFVSVKQRRIPLIGEGGGRRSNLALPDKPGGPTPHRSVFRAPCPYFICRGSQSTPGSSSLAACLTSSLSTEKLRRCSVWATATRIHSISGGSTRNGLQGGPQEGKIVCARKSIQISKVKGIRCLIKTVAFQRVQNKQTKNVLYVSHMQKTTNRKTLSFTTHTNI